MEGEHDIQETDIKELQPQTRYDIKIRQEGDNVIVIDENSDSWDEPLWELNKKEARDLGEAFRRAGQ